MNEYIYIYIYIFIHIYTYEYAYIYIYIYISLNNIEMFCLHSHTTFAIYTPLMMAQDQVKSTRLIISYGNFINQFPLDTIKSIWQLEKTYTKICRQNMFMLFNEICINKEMLPKCTHTHTHTHIYIYIYTNTQIFPKYR